jgi:hypothetical protein
VAFAYYAKLSRAQKAVYRRSDAVAAISLRGAWAILPLTDELRAALASEDRARVEGQVNKLAAAILADVGLPAIRVKVLSARPSKSWGELHGLYERLESHRGARITLWMRTARHKRVVAFKTFLRTLVHEICHHLDYELLELEDSFHTEGFFKRESSLVNQLVPR